MSLYEGTTYVPFEALTEAPNLIPPKESSEAKKDWYKDALKHVYADVALRNGIQKYESAKDLIDDGFFESILK